MAVTTKFSGSGTRYGVVFALDATTGLPMPAAAASTPYAGVEIEGIKGLDVTDPQVITVTFKGEDRPYAQDSLPPDELESFSFMSSKVNFDLDEALDGGDTRSYTNVNFRVENGDRRGNEPQVAAFFYRQAIDTDKNSSTFGRLRQYQGRVYSSARITKKTGGFSDRDVDTTYEGKPSNTGYTMWNEDIKQSTWGATEGSHLDGVFAQHPRWNFYRGNGTITAFSTTHAPKDSSHLLVWSDGTLVSPSAVATGAHPAFTLSAAPGGDKLVAALIQTTQP